MSHHRQLKFANQPWTPSTLHDQTSLSVFCSWTSFEYLRRVSGHNHLNTTGVLGTYKMTVSSSPNWPLYDQNDRCFRPKWPLPKWPLCSKMTVIHHQNDRYLEKLPKWPLFDPKMTVVNHIQIMIAKMTDTLYQNDRYLSKMTVVHQNITIYYLT